MAARLRRGPRRRGVSVPHPGGHGVLQEPVRAGGGQGPAALRAPPPARPLGRRVREVRERGGARDRGGRPGRHVLRHGRRGAPRGVDVPGHQQEVPHRAHEPGIRGRPLQAGRLRPHGRDRGVDEAAGAERGHDEAGTQVRAVLLGHQGRQRRRARVDREEEPAEGGPEAHEAAAGLPERLGGEPGRDPGQPGVLVRAAGRRGEGPHGPALREHPHAPARRHEALAPLLAAAGASRQLRCRGHLRRRQAVRGHRRVEAWLRLQPQPRRGAPDTSRLHPREPEPLRRRLLALAHLPVPRPDPGDLLAELPVAPPPHRRLQRVLAPHRRPRDVQPSAPRQDGPAAEAPGRRLDQGAVEVLRGHPRGPRGRRRRERLEAGPGGSGQEQGRQGEPGGRQVGPEGGREGGRGPAVAAQQRRILRRGRRRRGLGGRVPCHLCPLARDRGQRGAREEG
mmetsp:Transcript_97294/g.209762  ORF Transcript_97294/g.209762 Transcript_97294/m.209762 type:complete len:451 (+) Transcript_97294:152-1504(+)